MRDYLGAILFRFITFNGHSRFSGLTALSCSLNLTLDLDDSIFHAHKVYEFKMKYKTLLFYIFCKSVLRTNENSLLV